MPALQEPRGRSGGNLMIRFVLRFIGLCLLATAFVFFVYDGTKAIANHAILYTNVNYVWALIDQNSLNFVQDWLKQHLAWAWRRNLCFLQPEIVQRWFAARASGKHDLLRFMSVHSYPLRYPASGRENIGLPLAVAEAGTSSCITSQCSASLPSARRKMSTATMGFGPQPT